MKLLAITVFAIVLVVLIIRAGIAAALEHDDYYD